jgi:Protein of unknown function (DUF2865)
MQRLLHIEAVVPEAVVPRTSRRRMGAASRASALVLGALLVSAGLASPVVAQTPNWWPFGKAEQSAPVAVPAPIPSQPMARPGVAPGGAPGNGYGRPAQPGTFQSGPQASVCVQLEQRLQFEANKGNQSRDLLPKLEQDLRKADLDSRQAQAQLDRNDCYEYFLFSKTLKGTPACRAANAQLDAAKRRVGELDVQRQQLMSSGGRSYQDDIVRELARNNCGNKWTQQANNGGSSIWQDEDNTAASGGQFGRSGTYRTICVRLCDGYYFPVSFATLPEQFDRDADACQSKCAAPVELYYHPTPGTIAPPPAGTPPTDGIEQAVSHKTKQIYSTLKVAKLYRSKFLPGCSCKQSEYLPSGGTEKRAEAPPVQAVPKR